MNAKPYPIYKPSGVEWLGAVPEHWEPKRIGYMFRFYSGGTPSTTDSDLWDGDLPWVSSKDMKSAIITDTTDHISPDAVTRSATRIMPEGSLLIVNRSGILRHTLPVAIISRPMAINQDIRGCIPLKGVYSKFVSYLIEGNQSSLLALWRQQGATVESLDFEAMKAENLCLPPISEQQAIADFLDERTGKLDGLLGKKRELNAKLKEKRSALISRTVTKGLPPEAAAKAGITPNPKLKPSGIEWLGDIPEHWEAKRLKFLLNKRLQYGANEAAEQDDPDQPRYVRITDVNEQGNLREETFRSLPVEVARPYLLDDGDLLFARSGATAGKTFLYRDSWGVCAYAGYLIRAAFKKDTCPQFLKYFTSSGNYWQWLGSIYIQATIQNVSAEKYGDLAISLPSLGEQNAIVSYLESETSKVDRMIQKVETAIEKLTEYRTALITAAVTGKIDVRKVKR